MADEKVKIRELTETTSVDNTDYVPVDSASNGTKKYLLSRLAAQAEAQIAAAVEAEKAARQAADSGKVDKVAGKGLSKNDFTDALKTKLDGIETGAEVNDVTSVAGKTGAVTLGGGDVSYNEETTYADGTVGKAVTDLKSDLNEISDDGTITIDKSTGVKLSAYINNRVTPTVIASDVNTKTVYFACLPNTTYTINKVLSARFRVGYTTDIPANAVQIYGVIADNDATSLELETDETAQYIVIYYYDSANDTLSESTIYDSLEITYSTGVTAVDKVARAEIEVIEPGLSDDAKEALLACFAHVVWIDEHGQDYYDALESALYGEGYPQIAAVFNPGTHNVYEGDKLDSLRPYLTVTYYENGSSDGVVVSAYTLSGELTEGSQVISVLYQGCRTSFNVIVTNPFLYRLANTPVTFTGQTTDGIDTEIPLLATHHSFSIAFDVVTHRNYATDTGIDFIYYDVLPSGSYNGLFTRIYQSSTASTTVTIKIEIQFKPGATITYLVTVPTTSALNQKISIVATYDATSQKAKAYCYVNGSRKTASSSTDAYVYNANDTTLRIGARRNASYEYADIFVGVFNDFRLYDYALTETEALQFLEEVSA